MTMSLLGVVNPIKFSRLRHESIFYSWCRESVNLQKKMASYFPVLNQLGRVPRYRIRYKFILVATSLLMNFAHMNQKLLCFVKLRLCKTKLVK